VSIGVIKDLQACRERADAAEAALVTRTVTEQEQRERAVRAEAERDLLFDDGVKQRQRAVAAEAEAERLAEALVWMHDSFLAHAANDGCCEAGVALAAHDEEKP